MATSTVEDYLKRILLEQERTPGSPVSTGQIAERLQVAPGTATAMVKSLEKSGLVRYTPYSGVRLSRSGMELATQVLRRHRLVESFLVRILGYSWSEVHGDAEILEHAVSERMLERIDRLLGRPSFDPHGDPIPDSSGVMVQRDNQDLTGCRTGLPLAVSRVLDQRPDFLRVLEDHGILPGRKVAVLARDILTGTVELAAPGHPPLRLGLAAAATILVLDETPAASA